MHITIETPRLVLSDFRPNDFDAFNATFEKLQKAGQDWFNVRASEPQTVHKFFDTIFANQKKEPRDTFRLAVRRKDSTAETPELVGYVSLCDIYSKDDGKPDTGVMIAPDHQRVGYAREARLAIGHFGMSMGLERLECDIKAGNIPSERNVFAMGYHRKLNEDGSPIVVKTETLRGPEDWHRYTITRDRFFAYLPQLVTQHIARYIGEDVVAPSSKSSLSPRSASHHSHSKPWAVGATPSSFDVSQIFKVTAHSVSEIAQKNVTSLVPLTPEPRPILHGTVLALSGQ